MYEFIYTTAKFDVQCKKIAWCIRWLANPGYIMEENFFSVPAAVQAAGLAGPLTHFPSHSRFQPPRHRSIWRDDLPIPSESTCYLQVYPALFLSPGDLLNAYLSTVQKIPMKGNSQKVPANFHFDGSHISQCYRM